MRYFILFTILISFSFSTLGQKVEIFTDKEKYKLDETIKVTYRINVSPDSINLPKLEGLKLADGPSLISSESNYMGENTKGELRTYWLRPLRTGSIEINSPIYFIDSQTVKGKPISITVEPTDLTAEEFEEKRFQDFVRDAYKPQGSILIIIHDDMGYINQFDNNFWHFKRRLTEKEIKQLKIIK